MTKLSTLIQLSKAFAAEVNVSRDFTYNLTTKNEKIDGYLPNASSRAIFKEVLETLPTNTDRKAHLITASYGTGKSYLLLMLGHLLGNNRSAVLDEFRQKVTGKDDFYNDKLGQALSNYVGNGDPYLIVIPNYAGTDFNHALLQGLNEALRHQGINYIPATNYRRAADLLTRWKAEAPTIYEGFANRLSNMTVDAFIQLLNNTDAPAYQTFKTHYKEVVYADFSENHADDAYGVYAETAKAISLNGYRGIVILYDEFGTMLSNLINSPEGKGLAVQEFLEKVKRTGTGANIIFLAASHQDPTTLREDKQRDVTKVVGRFVRHQLDVTESEAEEILGTVFLHPDPAGFASVLSADYIADATLRTAKHNLYPDKSDTWVTEKILKNLYPLHPLSAYLLPRLSGEFAQNTRSMFNFLSPVEKKEGALALFLETTDIHTPDGRLNLFTPDRLLLFFEKNLAEAKSERVANLTDSYRTALRKLTDAPETEQLYRVLLLLTVVGGRLQPKKDLLFWSMGWPLAKRSEFDSLLNDLVVSESLERNPTTEVYEFPMSGSKSVSKIIQEEKQKLTGLSLAECATIWDRLEPRPKVEPTNQEDNYGANRHFRAMAVRKVIDLTGPIDSLTKYYRGTSEEYVGNGLVFYLLAPTEDDRRPMVNALQQTGLTQPYTFYAIPKDGAAFMVVQDRTIDYRALEETLDRAEVKANPNQLHNVREQLITAKARLQQAIKDLYQPSGWLWHYGAESTPHEFKSQTGFIDWFDTKVDELFTVGSVPTVKEDVLWFRDAEKPARSKALAMLWEAPKDEIFLYTSDLSKKQSDERILQNFFYNLKLTQDGKTIGPRRYGDVKKPESNTAAAAIFRHVDKALAKGGPATDPTDMLAGLLQAPYGLSRPLSLFILAAYARANRDELIVGDVKAKSTYTLSADLFERLTRKPGEFRMRRIDMPGPQKRYLDRLRTLFENQVATSFGDIGQKMTGLVFFLSPLQRTLIQQEKGTAVAAFYKSLDAFKEEMAASGANPDSEARKYLLEIIPDNLLGITRAEFEDDISTHLDKLIPLLREYKEFPAKKEREFRLETLTLLAQAVFGETLVGKEDIRKITESWFGKLPPANRQATYEQPKVNEWLSIIKNGPGRLKDLFDVYLADLTVHPDKDWTGNLMQCQSRYVDEFKAYRQAVESYTQSPLLVYQRIALTVFSVPPAECADEATFAALFSNWYASLSKQVKAHAFDDEAVRILLENVSSSLPVRQRFLEVIPTRWKDVEKLPAYLPVKWEDWTATQANAVAEEYERCCQVINNWKPAVSEADYFSQIGQVFGLADVITAQALQQALAEQWLPTLPERTRTAPWTGMQSIDAQFMTHVTHGGFYDFMIRTLPQHYKLPALQTMDEDTLLAFTREVGKIKEWVEAYRRPLAELIGVLTKTKYDTVADYQNTLYATIRSTEAYINTADKDDTLSLNAIPRLLLSEVRQNRPLDTVVSRLAEQLSLPTDHHSWTREEQLQFVRSTNEHLKGLQTWCFPQDRKMAEAKAELSKTIWKTCQDYGLSVGQMRKIMNDILGEQPANGHA